MGTLGDDQLEWLERERGWAREQHPARCLRHIPLWAVYPTWGWGTEDGARALSYLRRFGSVTVLNGHIHQVMRKGGGKHHLSHRHVDGVPPADAPGARPSRGR